MCCAYKSLQRCDHVNATCFFNVTGGVHRTPQRTPRTSARWTRGLSRSAAARGPAGTWGRVATVAPLRASSFGFRPMEGATPRQTPAFQDVMCAARRVTSLPLMNSLLVRQRYHHYTVQESSSSGFYRTEGHSWFSRWMRLFISWSLSSPLQTSEESAAFRCTSRKRNTHKVLLQTALR
jgi:hypothetical protein